MTNSDKNKRNSSLSVLTSTQSKPALLSKSLSKGMDENDDTSSKPTVTTIPLMTSYDDLVDHRKTLYTCYSSRAVVMYNVPSNIKDHTGSTPNMYTLTKSTKNQKMSRSCSGEDKSIMSNISASSQNIATVNSTSMTKLKASFKDRLFGNSFILYIIYI